MKKIQNVFLYTVFFITLLTLNFSTQLAFATDRPDPMISVEYLGNTSNLGSINKNAPPLFRDIQIFSSDIYLGGNSASKSAFLLRPQKALTLKIYTVENITDQGMPIPGELVAEHSLQPGDFCLFQHHIPEGMPNLIVCAQDEKNSLCWTPRFSGLDGSLEFDPGFFPFQKD